MALDFHTYLKAKNNYCYCYNGYYKEFIWQLLHVRKFAQKKFPNINIFISCVTEIADSINEDNVINANNFKNYFFLKTEEICFDMVNNPILKIMQDSKIEINQATSLPLVGKTCAIINKTKNPFKSYNDLPKLESYLSKNWNVVPIEQAEVLFAVECEELYKWAYLGKQTVLINTENNQEIYKKLFPKNEILNIKHI